MPTRYLVLIIGFIMSLAGGLIWSAYHYHSKYQEEKQRADGAEQRADSTEAITSNILRTVSIMNNITEANQHAKQQITLDASGAATDIKVAVADDDCARQPVPAAAANRLRQYADSLRSDTVRSDITKPDI
ncbi:DUF2570 domain-containing protein [Pseudocitrobacter faecalis]|uniref:DUF2570 domain-containing protein n=1 Tax=Pseudocitrobacter faecalis TaxID=1398493 RepID=UPI003314A45D